MWFPLHRESISIASILIYNVMNLVVNYNYFGHICNMVICVQLLVLDVKMNYVDHKLISSGFAKSNLQLNICISK
jgi:hypothetical protein